MCLDSIHDPSVCHCHSHSQRLQQDGKLHYHRNIFPCPIYALCLLLVPLCAHFCHGPPSRSCSFSLPLLYEIVCTRTLSSFSSSLSPSTSPYVSICLCAPGSEMYSHCTVFSYCQTYINIYSRQLNVLTVNPPFPLRSAKKSVSRVP